MQNAPHGTNCRTSYRAITLLAGLAISACKGILDVKNPNNIAEGALNNPQSATQQANGVQASTVRMLSGSTVVYAVATDELDWIGSRDAWLDQETGAISNYLNEFTDGAFPYVGEARYLGDQTVKRLEGFNTANTLRDKSALARAYLYTAITYATIPGMWDDFAFSNKTVPAAPVGRANMGTLYDKAVDYLTKALFFAGTDVNLQYDIIAWRAHTRFAKGVWQKITPVGQVAGDPLVNDAGAIADATAALALLGGSDNKFKLKSNIEAQPGINIWFEVNGRNESRVGHAYTNLKDPITGAADPTSAKFIAEFKGYGSQSGMFTMTSDRELRLILAEAALSSGDNATFTTQINAIRALDGSPPYAGQITALALLKFERMANLFLTRQRLADLYRFGDKVQEWAPNANFPSAVNTTGLLFPIPNVERLANPCITNPSACK